MSKKFNIRNIDHLEDLLKKEKFGLKDMIYDYINRIDFGTSFDEIYSYTGQVESEIKKEIKDLTKEGKIFQVNDLYFSSQYVDNLLEKIIKILEDYHKEYPLEQGLKKEELREKVAKKINPKDFNSLLNVNKIRKEVKADPIYVSLGSFEVSLDNENSKIALDIMDKIEKAKPNLLKDSDFASSKEEKKTLTFLLKDKLKKIENFIIGKEDYENIKATLIKYLEENKEITVAEFRDLNGFSRKIALAILEDFDKNKVTKRNDDKRVLY